MEQQLESGQESQRVPGVREVLQDEKGYFSPTQGAVVPVQFPTFKDLELPRKFFHMFGSIIAWIYLFSGMSHATATSVLAAYAVVILFVDAIRLKNPSMNDNYMRIFGPLMRQKESNTLNTSTYYVLGSLTVIAFFPKTVACVAIFYLSFGDPVAAIIGMRYGRTSIFGKSIEGSLACFLTCFFIGLPFFPPAIAAFGAFIASLSELLPSPLNDNFRIPVLSALGLLLVL